jgi:uncharacterized membrane protein YfcA
MEMLPLLIPLFFLTSFIYATAGFGGGSTYLALLFLLGVSYTAAPQLALICNLVVVTGGCFYFIRSGHFSLSRALPFVLASIPMAYLGGSIPIGKSTFILLLSLSLMAAGGRLLWGRISSETAKRWSRKKQWWGGLLLGSLIGGFSGLVGIGGGIFLSPLLLLLRWGKPKEVAGMASFFIAVNSLAGLAGQWNKSGFHLNSVWILPLGLAVLYGGQMGSRWAVGGLRASAMVRVTALLVLAVSFRMMAGLL